MEDKNSKRVYTKEENERFKKVLEELMNSDYVDDDDEDTPTPSKSKIKPVPTVAQVVEVLKSMKSDDDHKEDVTELSEKFDYGKYWIWMDIYASPTKVEIITSSTNDIRVGGETIYKVIVEGVENVAKLILALHVDIDVVEDIICNIIEALSYRIPDNWDADYYDSAEIIENLRKRYDIEYKTVHY